MNRNDAMTKACEMLAEAERDGISTYDTVTVVYSNGEYDVADNGDGVAGMNEHEAHVALTSDLMERLADDDDEDRAYWVIATKEGEEPKFVEQFDTRDEAIKAARSLAWDNEEDVLIVVDDDQGDQHWSNEGDWRNAVTH